MYHGKPPQRCCDQYIYPSETYQLTLHAAIYYFFYEKVIMQETIMQKPPYVIMKVYIIKNDWLFKYTKNYFL
jgi:hypothetical protein